MIAKYFLQVTLVKVWKVQFGFNIFYRKTQITVVLFCQRLPMSVLGGYLDFTGFFRGQADLAMMAWVDSYEVTAFGSGNPDVDVTVEEGRKKESESNKDETAFIHMMLPGV